MAKVLEPVLRRVITSPTLTPTELEAVDVDFDFGSLEGALILGCDARFVPSVFTAADDRSWCLIARPDYAVVNVADVTEGWSDPDFLVGEAYRTSFATEGGLLEVQSSYIPLIEPWLIHRNMSALFFDDNAIIMNIGIWYKNVLLSQPDLIGLLAGRR